MGIRDSKLMAVNTEQVRSTRNGLDVSARRASIEVLNAIVVDFIETSLAARQAHWNVRGRNVSSLQELFDRVARDLAAPTDALAERSAALGGVVRGTVQSVAADSRIKPYPVLSVAADEHIEAMSNRLACLGIELRSGIAECEHSFDPVSTYLLTSACDVTDKLLWLFESHIAKAH